MVCVEISLECWFVPHIAMPRLVAVLTLVNSVLKK